MKLTLDDAWKYHIEMWDWIVSEIRTRRRDSKRHHRGVEDLKKEWCLQHEIKVRKNCFFCEYNVQQRGLVDCTACPPRLIDPTFFCLYRPCYESDPIGFHKRVMAIYKDFVEK